MLHVILVPTSFLHFKIVYIHIRNIYLNPGSFSLKKQEIPSEPKKEELLILSCLSATSMFACLVRVSKIGHF